MWFELRFDMYPEFILFVVCGFFVLVGLVLLAYLIASRKRSHIYAMVLKQETELFDALTATAALTQGGGAASSVNIDEGTDPMDTEFISSTSDETERFYDQTQGLHTAFSTLPSGAFDPSVISDNYRIEREVGGGAMSRTFIIRSKKLGNPWFLKFVSNKDGRLASEEHILKLLNHISLPKIVDVFYRDEGVYLIETLVEGVSLNALGEIQTQISQYILIDWFEQIAQTLNYLHSMKPSPVLHLDLKPGNIMVTHDNRLALVDFGISRRFGEDSSGAVTARYAAPEQFGARALSHYAQLLEERFGKLPSGASTWMIDARTDIYSLGVVMFELATGQLPNQSNHKILSKCVSRELNEIILRCMATNPAARYHSAVELLDDLRSLKGSKIKMARTLFKRRLAAISALFALVASGGSFAGGYYILAFENAATLTSAPDIVTVSLQQSTAFTIERHMPDGRTINVDTSQIAWDNMGGNIAHIDGGRITGINEGEITLSGRHRNNDVSLHVRVVPPIDNVIQISQRYRVGRSVSLYAGSDIRQRVDGELAYTDFFSPESIAYSSSGALYIADAGVLRRIRNGISETLSIDAGFVAVSMVRTHDEDLFIITSPWQELDGRHSHALARVTDGIFDPLHITDALHTAIEDFVISPYGHIYFILRNEGLGATFLKALNLQQDNNITILTQLPTGSASLAIADDMTIYIGNINTGHIQAFINNELHNFAGVANERGFIDGTSPRFYMPQRMEYHAGHLYIWDFNTLRQIPASLGVAGEALSIAGIASPIYDPQLSPHAPLAENVILPHGRLMDFAITTEGILITDHKRGVIWITNHLSESPEQGFN